MMALHYAARTHPRALCDGVLVPLLCSAALSNVQTEAVARLLKEHASSSSSSSATAPSAAAIELPRRLLHGVLEAPVAQRSAAAPDAATTLQRLFQDEDSATAATFPSGIVWDERVLQVLAALLAATPGSSASAATASAPASASAAATGAATNATTTVLSAPLMAVFLDRLEACADVMASSPRLAQVILALVSPHAPHASLAAAHRRRWLQLATRLKSIMARAIAQHANAMSE